MIGDLLPIILMEKKKKEVYLPQDCWSVIFTFLTIKEKLLKIKRVSKYFNEVAKNSKSSSWTQFYFVKSLNFMFPIHNEHEKRKFKVHLCKSKSILKNPKQFYFEKSQNEVYLYYNTNKTHKMVESDPNDMIKEVLDLLSPKFPTNLFSIKDFQENLTNKQLTIYERLLQASEWINTQPIEDRKWIEKCLINYFKKSENINTNDLYETILLLKGEKHVNII